MALQEKRELRERSIQKFEYIRVTSANQALLVRGTGWQGGCGFVSSVASTLAVPSGTNAACSVFAGVVVVAVAMVRDVAAPAACEVK